MAPVTSSSTGVAVQVIDDPELKALIHRLSLLAPDPTGTTNAASGEQQHEPPKRITDETVTTLVSELARWPKWRFQEQADLYQWIKPLDAIDAALTHLLDSNPYLLLIGRKKASNSVGTSPPTGGNISSSTTDIQQAESTQDASSVPTAVIESVRTILRFLSELLRNAYNKMVFNSVAELSDLLAAADEDIATLALEGLARLSTPPMLHRQQHPETAGHSTGIHMSAPSAVIHGRLLSLAKGWGSRGTGLGLYTCVVTDDTLAGRSILPTIPGEIIFECYLDDMENFSPPSTSASDSNDDDGNSRGPGRTAAAEGADVSHLVRVKMSTEDMLSSPPPEQHSPSRQVEKRRRTGSRSDDSTIRRSAIHRIEVKSTAEVFFSCLDKIGGRSVLPPETVFALLADIRLARAYQTRAGRIPAVKRRLLAIAAILQSHPSQDVLVGYFHAQPELCAELCDLVRPILSAKTATSISTATTSASNRSSGGSSSSGSSSGGTSSTSGGGVPSIGRDAVTARSDETSGVPYEIQMLAIEALTALVARRDGASGGLSNIARTVNALGELGVAKGQFFGLLPSLIRFTLSSLSTFVSQSGAASGAPGAEGEIAGDGMEAEEEKVGGSKTIPEPEPMITDEMSTDEATGGASSQLLVEATNRASQLPRHQEEERLLEFIDVVLTLTSTVVSITTGTSALTDCGLIPALVQIASRDFEAAQSLRPLNAKSPLTNPGEKEGSGTAYAGGLLKFISAQAVQILEAAIVTHTSALVAFHELEGVDLLVKRLAFEVDQIKQSGNETPSSVGNEGDVEMEDAKSQSGDNDGSIDSNSSARPLSASRRVSLFSLMNCLTVVFHHQENSSSASITPASAAQLRKPELTNVVIDIMRNVDVYGGVLGSLVGTLLTDAMNSDPQVVHYVHSSGIADAFFKMIKGEVNESSPLLGSSSPLLPASGELIMSVPNVISALGLTEEGARDVKNANPFPAFLDLFCSPKYVMPTSRCLLNEAAAIVGTGLDEIMRHVPSIGGIVNDAVVGTLSRIVSFGKEVVEKEKACNTKVDGAPSSREIEGLRTCLLQYAYNISQLLEQILHHESHCGSFVDGGGLDALLELFPLLIPSGSEFLSHVSCLGGPSFAKLSHLTNSSAIAVAIRSISTNINPHKMIKKLTERLEKQFETLRSSQGELWRQTRKAREVRTGTAEAEGDVDGAYGSINGILDGVPRVPLHTLEDSATNLAATGALSNFLRHFVVTEWLASLLTSSIRVGLAKSSEVGTGWGRTDREWKKLLSSKQFEDLVDKLSNLHRCSMQEVCRVRTEEGYDQRELDRSCPPGTAGNNSHPALYRIRIVCPDGAVVRDGIEIDSSESVGGLEIGEIVEANDRCINSSGVLRYRTRSGWVSEQTRGHGREPIAEVLEIRGLAPKNLSSSANVDDRKDSPTASGKRKRVECGVTDLCSASAAIMARIQDCRTCLFSCMSRTAVSSARSLQYGSISFEEGSVGAHISSVVKILSRNIRDDFAVEGAEEAMAIALSEDMRTNANESAASAHITMYFGCMLDLLHSAVVEEKREREAFNVVLLFTLLNEGGILLDFKESKASSASGIDADLPSDGFIGAVRFVLSEGLSDMRRRALNSVGGTSPKQKLSRYTAASFPPALALLRRLVSRSILFESASISALSQMLPADLDKLVGGQGQIDRSFNTGRFCRSLYTCVAKISLEMWGDSRLADAPPHIIHPALNLLADTWSSLKHSTQSIADTSSGTRSRSRGARSVEAVVGAGGRLFARRVRAPRPPFEPSEETITRLAEMGFDRDHALEALETTESNRLEVAMEYCLSHPPPSPASAERRRAAREAASASRRSREGDAEAFGGNGAVTNNDASGDTSSNQAGSRSSDGGAEAVAAASSRAGAADAVESTSNDTSAAAPSAAAAANTSNITNKARDGESSMDVDDEAEKDDKEMTEEERKEQHEKTLNGASRDRTRKTLDLITDQIISGGLRIIEGHESEVDMSEASVTEGNNDVAAKTAAVEDENIVLVVCLFLLGICKDSPSLRSTLILETLKRFKSNLAVSGKRTMVAEEKERMVASLCHAAVVFLRALPRTRSIVLEEGLVGCIMSCLRSAIKGGSGEPMASGWPRWFAPFILLLDVMAQPIAFSIDGDETKPKEEVSKEFSRLCDYQKKQSAALSKAAYQVFSILNEPDGRDDKKSDKKQAVAPSTPATTTGGEAKAEEEGKGESVENSTGEGKRAPGSLEKASSGIAPIRCYTPMILPDAEEACMQMCLQILRRCSSSVSSSGSKSSPNSDVVQAVLLLLSRLVRSHKVASQCLKSGGAELICSLPKECRFDGNTEATTMVLRRLLEDSTTLQTLMETEIRAALAKQARQSRGTSRDAVGTKVPLKAFLQQMTSLICRDPLVFLRAAAISVEMNVDPSVPNAQAQVELLSAEVRAKNAKLLADRLGGSSGKSAHSDRERRQSLPSTTSGSASKRGRAASKSKTTHASKACKSKSPHRSSGSRRSLSPKKDGFHRKQITLNGAPANHVTALLFTEMMKASEHKSTKSSVCNRADGAFLSTVEYLEILANLVLAIPACAAAIHRYRPSAVKITSGKKFIISHALPGCPSPQSTAVNYLLHVLLPLARPSLPERPTESDLPENVVAVRAQRKAMYENIKLVQTSARLLVALVARAGEGRKRVIVELAYALNGGGASSPAVSTSTRGSSDEGRQMWALQSWGDLCIGLAAPRSSGASQDGNSTLSFEVIRLMLESGMAHAVVHAIGQVKLYHPLAPATAASLLRPLEIFSRVSVTDAVEKKIKDDEEKKKKKATSTSAAKERGSSDASLREDAMIEDGFHADAAPPPFGVDGDGVSGSDGWEEDRSSDESDSANMDDVDEDHESASDSMDRDTDDEDMIDEESDSMDGDSDMEGESLGDSERDSDDDDHDDDDEDPDDEVSSDEMDQDAIEDNAFFEAQGDADVGIGLPQDDLDADWTLLGEGGENPMALAAAAVAQGGRLPPGNPSGPGGIGMALAAGLGEEGLTFPPSARGSATLEDMIGNILRSGENPLDASFADLESALGIRLSNQLESLGRIAGIPLPRGEGGGGSGDGGTGDGNDQSQADSDQSLRRTDRGPVGSVPAVLQIVPPDTGYIPTGRLENFNAMEYMYGGPVVGAGPGGRFYNTTSSSTAVDNEISEEEESARIPASVSTLLFPGGPVASTHVRRLQLPHPLLRDVELGPINALVSSTDRRRSGDRRARAEASSGFGRGRLVRNIILSDGSGNIVRQSNPRRLGDPSRASGSSGGVFGWTEDDRAPDMGLSDEFEIAFREVMSQATAPLAPNPPAEMDENGEGSAQPPSNEAGSNEAGSIEAAVDSTDQDETMEQNPENGANNDAAGGDRPASAPEAPLAAGVSLGGDTGSGGNAAEDASPPVAAPAQNQVDNSTVESGGSGSEGENVASSLASGLRLSSSRESPRASQLEPASEDTQPEESTQDVSHGDTEMQDATMNVNAESAPQPDGSAEPEENNETTHADSAASAGDATAEDTGNANDENGQQNDTAEAVTVTVAAAAAAAASSETSRGNAPNAFGLVCPPGMDLEVFNSLPQDMQQEVAAQHQSAENVAGQLDATSGLDPEALAALPEEMRREVIEQERQERERRERAEAPADISNAQEMDNASFLVSLAPELREEVLLTADDEFLNSLPQHIIAEAQVLRERRAFGMRREQQPAPAPAAPGNARSSTGAGTSVHASTAASSSRKKQRLGRAKVEFDRDGIIFVPSNIQEKEGPVITATAMKSLVKLFFLLSPIRPHRLLQKVLQNLCCNGQLRQSLLSSFVALLNGDSTKARAAVNALDSSTVTPKERQLHQHQHQDEFPPSGLIGTAPAMEFDASPSSSGLILSRQRNASNVAAAIAGNIPMSARALSENGLPPILAKRIIDSCIHLAKHVPRMNLDALISDAGTKMGASPSCALDHLLDLLGKQLYLKSSTILEHLLCMIEGVCSPLSLIPKEGEAPPKLTDSEIEAAKSSKKEWIEVPRPVVTPCRLKLLCSLLKLEYVKDSSFTRVNTIARRLCRVEENRHFILHELSGVAGVLAEGATKDLQELSARLREQVGRMNAAAAKQGRTRSNVQVSLASSTTESKLLRVLQALSSLSGESQSEVKKIDGLPVASPELVSLMESINLESLWSELTLCLRFVSILEGVELKEDSNKDEKDDGGDNDGGEGSGLEDGSRHSGAGQEGGTADIGRKLQNSAAGVLTRFLPAIEAFFVVNGVAKIQPKTTRSDEKEKAKGDASSVKKSPAAESKAVAEGKKTEPEQEIVLGGMNLVDFVSANRILLNALVRSNPSLLDKGLRAMVTVPGCRPFLDFDVKRQWFRTYIRRLRQHASRRHGSLRLHIRRKHVFEDAYHQLQVRNAEEMRGRLHVTFTNEEGVDAGGLSREFFAILAKEMFNPNYALFTSTEDGCTFQPNPNSSINHDHLHYFRFVGRIVGKAVSDGYLLDAHFTRSLYKHMLGVKPTHHDMEAIDPDYYKNLKLILEHNLDDIGLELTFSIEHHSFGGLQTIDLIPDGRNVKVTEESKEKYVSLVCQHRMTTSIESQIKAFLEGFHGMIKPELISIFTAKELELLISGLPDIDIFDLKKNTDYQGYRSTDKEVEWFWNVMTSLTRSQKAAFLQFVTGSSKVPLNGFTELQGMRGVQKFSIHKVGGSSGALMSAHTCFNSLDLPVYKSEEELKEKLLYAISEGAGGFMFA